MSGYTLITGGAGFIGTNLAHRILTSGGQVLLFDNLSRTGSSRNAEWLRRMHGSLVHLEVADVRDRAAVKRAVAGATRVYHFAAQVAVTTSLERPYEDFDVNARGTLNVLEELRLRRDPPPLLFTSTNKVYGSLEDIELRSGANRYDPVDSSIRAFGISENRRLEFHSPYGCSKGAADQYVLDYARNFGLPAVVFRMSCIFGPHQSGTEDQGWVAHFLIRAMAGEPITIYGDGKQFRDLLFADDLVDALLLAHSRIGDLAGHVFNIGGGSANTISLRELLALIGEIQSEEPRIEYETWRTGDQRYYASDTRRYQAATGWRPQSGALTGVAKLHEWLADKTSSGCRP